MWECWVSLKLKPEEFGLEAALCGKCLEITLLWFGAIQVKIDWLINSSFIELFNKLHDHNWWGLGLFQNDKIATGLHIVIS